MVKEKRRYLNKQKSHTRKRLNELTKGEDGEYEAGSEEGKDHDCAAGVPGRSCFIFILCSYTINLYTMH